MSKEDYLVTFWDKRWNKNSGYLFSENYTKGDIINARIRYDSKMNQKIASFIQHMFPSSISKDEFWSAVAAEIDEITSGKWFQNVGKGRDFMEHKLLEMAVNGSPEEREKAKGHLYKIGLRSVITNKTDYPVGTIMIKNYKLEKPASYGGVDE